MGGSDAAKPAEVIEADAFSPAAASEIFDRASAEQLGAKLLADVTLGVKPDAEKAEIKDARIIFDMVWREVVKKHGIEKMSFPREVVWLSGAPGAGKGTMASFILKEREIPHRFEVSSLLGTPEMRKKKEAGVLIGDLEVVMAVRCNGRQRHRLEQKHAPPSPDTDDVVAPDLLALCAHARQLLFALQLPLRDVSFLLATAPGAPTATGSQRRQSCGRQPTHGVPMPTR
jgi:hypothetical protein